MFWLRTVAFLIGFIIGYILISPNSHGQSLGGCYDVELVKRYAAGMGAHALPALSELETERALSVFHQAFEDDETEYDFAMLVESESGGALLVGLRNSICSRAMWEGDNWKVVKKLILGTPA